MKFDKTSEQSDNDGEYIKISKKDIKPSYDTRHEHQYAPTEEESDIEGTTVYKCINRSCPLGMYVRDK